MSSEKLQEKVQEKVEEVAYHAKDALTPAVKTTGITGGAGLFVASVQATLARENIGALGTLTRYGATAATMAAVGGAYTFFSIASGNLRERDDAYNSAIGGFVSGAILGARFRSFPSIVGYGTSLAVVMAALKFTGSDLSGHANAQGIDSYEQKEQMRRNKRRPISETIEELGEGRGVYGPGYAERRAQRIKEKYGIDVPTPH